VRRALRALRLLGLVLAAGAPGSAQAVGLGVSPMTVEMDVQPGNRFRQVVRVGNASADRPLAVVVGVADWTLDADSRLVLLDPGSAPGGASGWIRFAPASFELAPGEVREVRVDVVVPVRVERAGDHRAALLVSTRGGPPAAVAGRAAVRKRYQMASLFHLTVGTARSSPELVGVDVEPAPAGAPRVWLRVENDGARHARVSGELRLRDPSGAVALRQPVRGVVLDRTVQRLGVPVSDAWSLLAPGRYRLDLSLQAESGVIHVDGELPELSVAVREARRE